MGTLFLGFNAVVLSLYILTIIGVIITVILENRNPLKTSAWVLIIGLIPIVGLIAYVVFGQEQRKLYRINKRYYRRLQKYPRMHSIISEQISQSAIPREYANIVKLVARSSDSPLLSFDDCEIYTEGGTFYSRLIEDIQQATKHIHIESYIFDDDSFFALLSDSLIAKKQEGLDIRIIYDYLGSYSVGSKRWDKLKSYGIQIYPFLPVKIPLLSSTVNYRNHRKITVIDGRIGYVGGMNFANRYQDGNELGKWRDTHFRFTGSAVSALQTDFLMDWYSVSKRVVHVERYFSNSPQESRANQSSLLQFIFGGPLDEHQAIEQALTSLIYQAQRSILIQTPYLLPTESLYKALISASLSGINTELMIPSSADSWITFLAMDSYLEGLLQAGVKIHRYQTGFLHSKLMIVDDSIACIGSTNLDFRSLEHNFEVMGIVYDHNLVQRLQHIYAQDLRECKTLELSAWQCRPYTRRLGESIMRLFSPLL